MGVSRRFSAMHRQRERGRGFCLSSLTVFFARRAIAPLRHEGEGRRSAARTCCNGSVTFAHVGPFEYLLKSPAVAAALCSDKDQNRCKVGAKEGPINL